MMASVFATMIPIPEAEASLVVITDPVQLVDDGANNRMIALVADSEGNIHVVYSQNTRQLYYTMLDPRSETLIAPTQISNNGGSKAWHPDVAVDSMDRVHIVWADKGGQHSIVYTALNPWLDDRDGSASSDGTITVIEDTLVAQRAHNRDWPTLAIDSRDNVHISWEDSYDDDGWEASKDDSGAALANQGLGGLVVPDTESADEPSLILPGDDRASSSGLIL